jgi:hypothetical protein
VIFKELDALDWQAGAGLARRAADEQMPYYLRRYFGESTQVDVLNQLCVTTGGVVTRIDHLLLHAHGLVVVDSHSVSGHLQVEEDGRWVCLEGSQMRVIRSPVTRAYEQALSLKAFLEKKVRQKGFFDRVELDVLVAVPDTEAIRWPRSGAQIEVCNADALPRLVNARIEQYRTLGVGPGLLVPQQRRRLAEFLVLKHRPHLVRPPQEGPREGSFGG